MKENKETSIGNLPNNFVSAFIIASSFDAILGLICSIGALILEKDDELVRSYSKQALVLSIFSIILNIFIDHQHFYIITFIGAIFKVIQTVVIFITALHAFKKDKFSFDFINKIVEQFKL